MMGRLSKPSLLLSHASKGIYMNDKFSYLSPTINVFSGSRPCVSWSISNIIVSGLPMTNGSRCAGTFTAATILPVPGKVTMLQVRLP